MFDVLDRPLLWIPVRWPGLKPTGPDGSGVAQAVENEIEVLVELKEKDDVKALIDPEDGKGLEKLEAVMLFATDWRKVVAGGNPLPFTRENVDKVLRSQLSFFDGFRLAYIDAVLGKVETREGNCDALPANGQAGEAASATTENPKPSETATVSA